MFAGTLYSGSSHSQLPPPRLMVRARPSAILRERGMCRLNAPLDGVAPRRIWLCWEVGGWDYIPEEDEEGDLLLLDGVGFIRNDRMNTEMNSTCVQCRAKLTSDDNSPFRINAAAASPRRMGAFEYLIIPIVFGSLWRSWGGEGLVLRLLSPRQPRRRMPCAPPVCD